MEDISEMLAQILSDDGAMAQMQEIMSMLGLGGGSEPSSEGENTPGLGELLGILGLENAPSKKNPTHTASAEGFNLNPKLLGMLGQLMSAYQKPDKNENLLLALRPYLQEKRQHKIKDAIKIIKLVRLWPFLRQSGLLDNFLGGEEHG